MLLLFGQEKKITVFIS